MQTKNNVKKIKINIWEFLGIKHIDDKGVQYGIKRI